MINNIIDLHIHSNISDGSLSIEQIVKIANEKGITVGIADHSGKEEKINSDEKLNEYIKILSNYPVYKSTEVTLNKEIPLSNDTLKKLDYVIGGVHYIHNIFYFDKKAKVDNPELIVQEIQDLLIFSFNNYPINILAHPTLVPWAINSNKAELINEKWAEPIIESAVKNNVAFEISSRWKVPEEWFIEMALEMGAKFSIGSDGHHIEDMFKMEYAFAMIEKLKIDEDRLFKPKT